MDMQPEDDQFLSDRTIRRRAATQAEHIVTGLQCNQEPNDDGDEEEVTDENLSEMEDGGVLIPLPASESDDDSSSYMSDIDNNSSVHSDSDSDTEHSDSDNADEVDFRQ